MLVFFPHINIFFSGWQGFKLQPCRRQRQGRKGNTLNRECSRVRGRSWLHVPALSAAGPVSGVTFLPDLRWSSSASCTGLAADTDPQVFGAPETFGDASGDSHGNLDTCDSLPLSPVAGAGLEPCWML